MYCYRFIFVAIMLIILSCNSKAEQVDPYDDLTGNFYIIENNEKNHLLKIEKDGEKYLARTWRASNGEWSKDTFELKKIDPSRFSYLKEAVGFDMRMAALLKVPIGWTTKDCKEKYEYKSKTGFSFVTGTERGNSCVDAYKDEINGSSN